MSDMKPLPDHLKIKFFKFLYGEESVNTFEQWVYETDDLENQLTNDDYLNLISLDFSEQNSQYEAGKILEQYIEAGDYETWKLRRLLTTVLEQAQNLPEVLSQFYTLYCKGYDFLDGIGLGCGLSIRVPLNSLDYSADCWEDLSHEEKHQLLHSLLPKATAEAQTILSWLDERKIVITNEQDDLGAYIYIDRRSDSDKKLASY